MKRVLKKNGTYEKFDANKIINAVEKSADRAKTTLTDDMKRTLLTGVATRLLSFNVITVRQLHEIVIAVLADVDETIRREYVSYRDYKKRLTRAYEQLADESKRIIYDGDNENANKNSTLVSTKKGLIVNEFSKQMMMEYEVPKNVALAHNEGWLYIHDLGDRLFKSINCCLFDMANLLKDGFSLNGIQYTRPTSVESVMRVIGDVVLEASSQQYGGFTIPELDSVIAPYVERGIEKSMLYYTKQFARMGVKMTVQQRHELAVGYVTRQLEQGFQAIETRLNTISNSNTQTPFVTLTFGLDTTDAGRLVSYTLLKNRINGLGKQHLTPVFPKLVFLHRKGVNNELYKMAIECSSQRMYPDYLSLDNGYLGEMYDKYGLAVSPMGCRAFLSPWYGSNGRPVFIGRANCGAVTLNLVKMAIEANGNEETFYDLIDKYFDVATEMHLWTYKDLCSVKASSNPLFFVEGGCHIKLDPNESIKRAIDTFTWSYGYVGLDEASKLMTGKQVHEDNTFSIEVLTYIDNLIHEAKEKHNMLFAMYATPSESLRFKFRNKDKEKYGLIEGINDKLYYTNSFHVNVEAPVNPLEKQRIEEPMFNISTGGRIHYAEFPIAHNKEAIKQIVDAGMRRGFYMGINMQLDSCNECYERGEFENGVCPKCGSTLVTSIARVCGYLGYNAIDGKNRFNEGINDERKNRVDHFGLDEILG